MFVCLSPGGQSLTQGEVAKDKLLVGTVDGIFAFQKRGGSWESQGTMVPGKHFSSIVFEHSSQALFGGTYSSEIYASADLGKNWERRDGGNTWTTIDNINPDAHRVLIPTNDPSKLYGTAPTTNCGPETPAGFCVSSDGGASWKSMTPRDFRIGYVDPFFVHPGDPNLLFVAGAKTGPGTWRK